MTPSTETTPTAVESFDWTATDNPSAAVVSALADATGAGPTEIDPLYRTLDPDALDAVVASSVHSAVSTEARVAFTHAGHRVVLKANGMGYLFEGPNTRAVDDEPREGAVTSDD